MNKSELDTLCDNDKKAYRLIENIVYLVTCDEISKERAIDELFYIVFNAQNFPEKISTSELIDRKEGFI